MARRLSSSQEHARLQPGHHPVDLGGADVDDDDAICQRFPQATAPAEFSRERNTSGVRHRKPMLQVLRQLRDQARQWQLLQ